MVPAIQNVGANNIQYFLQNSQKNAIISGMGSYKALNMELIPEDPVYIAFTLGLSLANESLTPDIANQTYLVIQKDPNALTDSNQIITNVNSIFVNYFSSNNAELGQLISINDLTTQISAVPGVLTFQTRRVTANETINNNGLVLLMFNPNYSNIDINSTTIDTQLSYFKFPFLWNQTLINNIIIE